jgi:hypothetical protein
LSMGVMQLGLPLLPPLALLPPGSPPPVPPFSPEEYDPQATGRVARGNAATEANKMGCLIFIAGSPGGSFQRVELLVRLGWAAQ